MPVLIVGAASSVGRRLASGLLRQDAQVRAYVQEDDPDLRSAGCHVAIGEQDDLGRLESAMEQVHTVVHLVGGASPPRGRSVEWVNQELTDIAVRAAVSADVSRFLAVSELGADTESPNPYLRARGRADDLVRAAGIPYLILRCAPILGVDSPLAHSLRLAASARLAASPGSGTQSLTPVSATDVADALLAADTRATPVDGVHEFGGPERVTYDELVTRATGRSRVAHRRSVPGLPRALADAWAVDRCADTTSFLEHFPMTRTPLDRALKQALSET